MPNTPMQEDVKTLYAKCIAPNEDYPPFREDQKFIDELEQQGIRYPSEYADLLQSYKTSDELRLKLISIIGTIHYKSAVPIFLSIAQDESKDIALRRGSLVYSASINPTSAYPIMVELAVHDPSDTIRVMVVSFMFYISTKRCLRFLIKLMQSDQNEAVRAEAARSIGLMTRSDKAIAVQPLLNLLNNLSERPIVRAYAAEALGFIRTEQALDSLARFLNDPSPSVRYMCAYSLGEVGNADHLPLLELLLNDNAIFETWGTVAEAAQEAIQNLTWICPI